MPGERRIRVWERVAAAGEGDGPVTVAAVCRAAVRMLGVDGASVTAVSGLTVREPLFASDQLSARLEELQLTTGDGPAGQDFRLGSPVLIPYLESAVARWPGFAPAALAAGAGAMFLLPMQAGAIRVGVLSLYRVRPGPLAPGELADVLVLADIALQLVLDTAAGITALPEYRPVDGMSASHAEVYQATGMITVQLGVNLDDAFARLRAHAFTSNRALGAVASDVVSRLLRFDPEPGRHT
ncbi:MAG: ANTAR domain-containing protein [Actinomycetota bacterium]